MDDRDLPLFPVDFFQFPSFDKKPSTVSVFVEDGLMINSHSLHVKEAAEFLDWVLSTEAQQKQLEFGLPFPANINVDLKNLPAVAQELGQLIASHSTATFMHIDHALSPAISNPFLDFLQAVLVGAMSPEEAATQTEKVATGVDSTSLRRPYETDIGQLQLGY
jgi:ABC-type glycerol-3-phosphate transport system substrate-binding protein